MKTFFDPLVSDILCKVRKDFFIGSHYHRHDGVEIYLLLRGTIKYYIERHCYSMSRGDMIIVAPEQYHRAQLVDLDVYERITLNIRTNFLKSLSSQHTNLTACFEKYSYCNRNLIHLNNQDLNQFLTLACQMENTLEQDSYGNDLLSLGLLLQILVKTNMLYFRSADDLPSSQPDLMPVLVRDTMSYIEEHLTEAITLSDLSREVFHNGTYISRRFKSVTGLTIQQYILYKRISLAQKYLQEGYSLTDTCWMSGFNNYSNFSRSFTQQVGCSPKKYQYAHLPQNSSSP